MAVATKERNKRLQEAITWLHDNLGWSYEYMGKLVGEDDEPISGNTISRWEDGDSFPQAKNRTAAYQLCDLHYFLTAAFEKPEHSEAWISRFHKGLEARPVEILEDGDFDKVIGELAALESGAFF